MQKFTDIKYQRVDFESTKEQIEVLAQQVTLVKSSEELLELYKKINAIHIDIEQNYDYADICNMRDDSKEFYKEEINFWNEYKPKFDLLLTEAYKQLINSPYIDSLIGIIPPNFINTIKYQTRVTSPDILELQKAENQLKVEYRKIVNGKTIFNGKEYNLNYIRKFFTSDKTEERKKAHDAYNDFFYKSSNELMDIFIKLVNVRNKIAKILGFKNYSQMSIYTLRRFGYDYDDIMVFRQNIQIFMLPLLEKINDIRRKELNVDELKYYDTIMFKESPKSLYQGQELLNKMIDILKKIDPKLSSYYQEMLNSGYIDVLNRDHKVTFFITNYLVGVSEPVITGNFSNNYNDIYSISHEYGHSYQKHLAGIEDQKHVVSPLLKYPTFDIAEMFSYAMELLVVSNAQELFNKEDYNKFIIFKMQMFIKNMLYYALGDEFQEKVYEQENLDANKVKELWLSIVSKVGLESENKGHINLDNAGYFFRQSHFFENPFYFIDYAISYFGAFDISMKSKENFSNFESLAAVASYYPLKDLITMYGLSNPFKEESFKKLSLYLSSQLDRY